MNTKNKFGRNKGVNQVNPYETKDNYKKQVALSTEYYTDWTTEKCCIEKPKSKKIGNSAETISSDFQIQYTDQYY